MTQASNQMHDTRFLSTTVAVGIAVLLAGCAHQSARQQPLDPFDEDAGTFSHASTAFQSDIFPAGYGARPGPSSAPTFSLYGEMPNARSGREPVRSVPDGSENLTQVSFALEGADFDPSISPDGKLIYFASTRHRPTSDIYFKSIEGTSVTQLTSDPAHDVMPAVSPDGKRVAFASNRAGSWDIFVMNADGGQAVQITRDPADELHASWSADGSRLAYCRLGRTSDRWEIWVVDVQNPAVAQFVTYGLFPEWHPQQDRLVFQRSRDRGDRLFSIWTIDYVNGEGVAPTEIASSPVAAVINPNWSPDGSYITFATVVNPYDGEFGDRPAFADIWIVQADGRGKSNLTGGKFVNLMPCWGVDNQIYFISDRNGRDNLWSIGPSQAILAADTGRQARTGLANVPTGPEETP